MTDYAGGPRTHRDKFTEKLVRIIKTIDRGIPAASVHSLHVFGSYSRGAIECGDLDLILIYGPFKRKAKSEAIQYYKGQHYSDDEAENKAEKKLKGDITRALRKPGERIQIILDTNFTWALDSISSVKPDEAVLLWSRNDRNWQAKLAAITPDPNAGRKHREHLFPLPRLRDDLATMNMVMELIATQQLTIERIAIDEVKLDLDTDHARRFSHWKDVEMLGRKSTEILPFALQWLQNHGYKADHPDRTEIYGEGRTLRVEIGKPSLETMVYIFNTRPQVKRQALIPHVKKGGPNEILAFERGPKWKALA